MTRTTPTPIPSGQRWKRFVLWTRPVSGSLCSRTCWNCGYASRSIGAAAEREHRAIARLVKRAGVTYLLTFGPLSKLTHDAATVRFKAHYDQKNVLAEYLSELLSKGDAVLIKGSRGMKMEDVVTFVRERLERGLTSRGERAA